MNDGVTLDTVFQSVQSPPDALKKESGAAFSVTRFRGPLLPAWGTRLRLRWLRDYYFHDRNWMGQGAFSGLGDRVASTPYEVTGPAGPELSKADKMFKGANFGAGWGVYAKIMVLNFLRYDIGAWAEVIAPGNPLGPILGQPTGIATLDPMRVFPTGDPIYPAIYVNQRGEQYLLHHERVIQIVDAPDGSDDKPGWGLSTQSRAVSIIKQVLLMAKYNEAYLDDEPVPSLTLYSNISQDDVNQMWARYEAIRRGDALPAKGKRLELFGLQTDTPVAISEHPFSVAPHNFDYVAWVDLCASAFALVLSVDKQEIWELSRGNMGTSTQSEILHRKSQGRKIAALYSAFEREHNNKLLPADLRFEFAFQDAAEDLERAQVAETQARTVQIISGVLSVQETREYLAMTDETMRQILTDDEGRVRTLTDQDTEPDVAIADDVGEIEELDTEPAQQSGFNSPFLPPTLRTKEWNATRLEFIDLLSELIVAGQQRGYRRGRYAANLRRLLNTLGQQAYRDGLVEGGAGEEGLEPEDLEKVQRWLASTSSYREKLIDGTTLEGQRLNDIEARARAELWAAKSLREIYMVGKVEGAANKLQVWELGPTEHCADCLRLAGQVHRLRHWKRSGWMPGVTKLECGGYKCQCELKDTTDTRSRGRF